MKWLNKILFMLAILVLVRKCEKEESKLENPYRVLNFNAWAPWNAIKKTFESLKSKKKR